MSPSIKDLRALFSAELKETTIDCFGVQMRVVQDPSVPVDEVKLGPARTKVCPKCHKSFSPKMATKEGLKLLRGKEPKADKHLYCYTCRLSCPYTPDCCCQCGEQHWNWTPDPPHSFTCMRGCELELAIGCSHCGHSRSQHAPHAHGTNLADGTMCGECSCLKFLEEEMEWTPLPGDPEFRCSHCGLKLGKHMVTPEATYACVIGAFVPSRSDENRCWTCGERKVDHGLGGTCHPD